MSVSRRHLLKIAGTLATSRAAGLGLGLPAAALAQDSASQSLQRVAAIQFTPKIGDIKANLARADVLVREALSKNARWVVLPEFFPTGTALHRSLFDAHQPLDGAPARMLKDLAMLGRAYVGGSFLARSGGDVFNTFVLACPDGSIFTHDKDFPTHVFESAFYAGGEDAAYVEALARDGARTVADKIAPRIANSSDGAFDHAGTGIGASLCWESVRSRTAKRLVGKVDIVLASSGWWTTDPDLSWGGLPVGFSRSNWTENQTLINTAPQRMARKVGAPIVHANFAGQNPGYTSLAFDQEATGRYLGSSQIVDAQGKTVASFGTQEGVLIGEVKVGRQTPLEAIADEFWFPEVSQGSRRRWASTGATGRDYYVRETRARLAR